MRRSCPQMENYHLREKRPEICWLFMRWPESTTTEKLQRFPGCLRQVLPPPTVNSNMVELGSSVGASQENSQMPVSFAISRATSSKLGPLSSQKEVHHIGMRRIWHDRDL